MAGVNFETLVNAKHIPDDTKVTVYVGHVFRKLAVDKGAYDKYHKLTTTIGELKKDKYFDAWEWVSTKRFGYNILIHVAIFHLAPPYGWHGVKYFRVYYK